MDNRKLFQEENEAVRERLILTWERIESVENEESVGDSFRDYFCRTAGFLLDVRDWVKAENQGRLEDAPLKTLQEWNDRLYGDILPESYGESYANPAYAVGKLGEKHGPLLCFLYAQLRGEIIFACEHRMTEVTILNELFIEIYNMYEGETPDAGNVKDALYWFVSDYSDRTVEYRVRESLDPELSFARDIIMDSSLEDLRYLYRFGEYVSRSELDAAQFLNSLPQETLELMAGTYTEGYRKGFQVMGRDLTKKKTVMIRYELGFERMVKHAVGQFETMGLKVVICRAPVWSTDKNLSRKIGYYGTSPNKQYEYDHRYDSALYLDKAFKDRRLALLRAAYEKYKKEAGEYAGPAVIETFGQEGFDPVNKKEAWSYTESQERLSLEMAGETARIQNEYIPGSETGFTIIAFPAPEIGERFEEIFKETIAINTLDYEFYKKIQQVIIDVLDRAEYVTVKGKYPNTTDLRISLHPLRDRKKETVFENCVADVNIPLGEVFTSPMLRGTEGVLNVGDVYVGGIQFKNLRMVFKDGMIVDYSCGNFSSDRESRELVKQMILKNHDSLPMGEFAIGTNTTAYAMASKYGILKKLPILIVEKMGPHFAVGDTCYSWSEDAPVYNPDGKEIIARDNEVSLKRKEDVSQAYYNCHTDITIPYAELDSIVAVGSDGTAAKIISGGRFVLPGTEELNKPLT